MALDVLGCRSGRGIESRGACAGGDFKGFEWVVWRIEVQDPSRLAGEDPDLDERTKKAMTELAVSLGCVYEHCVDVDTYEDGTPYYAWWVRLPAVEHAWRGPDGLPQALGPLRQYLAIQLPDGLKWEITPDREYTVDHAGSTAMRASYDEVIAPFERALMPLRRDGADALDHRGEGLEGAGEPLGRHVRPVAVHGP
ncbi:hypothetical protein [Streptomyces xanthochromogenes]|uniref:hypothetical protein n=1 Tax=Streptomyces xanthochromogenes TaxID=67384 RepID=UPI0038207CC2